ncbi:MAG TPA: NAD-dependent epimerase/dehydratase family protein, partial [Gemmatimonadaceae bacterium]|nr:NAD-dependent epimerase/dehydratase family protein [Gemmatimonadaceae bacterium]
MSPRALVTGGAGFIGSHVADLFIEEGFDVEVIDDLSTGNRSNLNERAVLHEVSVASPDTRRIVSGGRFEIVVHLAAQIDVRKSVADPVFDATTNILGTLNILEAIRESGRKTRIAFTSTGGAIYGDFNTPPNVETYSKDPESPYAISKLAAEYYLSYYGRVHGLEHVALRFGNVYGPRQDPHGEAGVVAIFCNRILQGKPLTIFGDGLQTRDYVYVGDVARAVFLAATSSIPAAERVDARAFNVGTGVGTSVVDLARLLQEAANSDAEIVFAPKRPGEQQESFLNA